MNVITYEIKYLTFISSSGSTSESVNKTSSPDEAKTSLSVETDGYKFELFVAFKTSYFLGEDSEVSRIYKLTTLYTVTEGMQGDGFSRVKNCEFVTNILFEIVDCY